MYFLSKSKRISLSSRVAKYLVVLFILTYFFNISLAITDVQKLSVWSSFPVKLYCRTAYLLGINTEKCTNPDSSFSKEDAIIPEPVADPIPEESIPESTETAPIDDPISTVDSTASSTEEILP